MNPIGYEHHIPREAFDSELGNLVALDCIRGYFKRPTVVSVWKTIGYLNTVHSQQDQITHVRDYVPDSLPCIEGANI